MMVAFPVLVEKQKDRQRYGVRALFVPGIVAEDCLIDNAFATIRVALRKRFHESTMNNQQRNLPAELLSPHITCGRLRGVCHLRRRTVNYDLAVLSFPAFGRTVSLFPGLNDWTLPLPASGETAKEHLREALLNYFRDIEKDNPEALPKESLELNLNAFVHYLEVDVPLATGTFGVARPSDRAVFGRSSVKDGYSELAQNARSLVDLWPDGLERAYHREDIIRLLQRVLTLPERKPILLVGRTKSGKTTILHEALRRIIGDRKQDPHRYREGFFLIQTNRLMAGMSFVGDWEKRMTAITHEAEKYNHTLIFENLPAIFHLGRSAGSRLCIADILKSRLEKQKFRFLAECTETALARIRELDRAFCDLFEIVRVDDIPRDHALRILISGLREIEHKYSIQCDTTVIPAAEALHRRYNRGEAIYGAVLDFLRGLAAAHDSQWPITQKDVLRHFGRLSGFSESFLDGRIALPRVTVRRELAQEWIGQEAVVDILTDTLVTARAGIQDPTKPYGCFLLLGPTGVGKTECAKGLARHLFGKEDRLLRFDMNEFVTPGSAARLCGTTLHPDGLLTSAVRLQPFSVILFDEIEKAHPDVYDLLLQVLGEGRLTDAFGNTTDFTNTIVLLTSNLGVSEASRNLGFGATRNGGEDAVFLDAARRFFRPEFFNRLDAVIPFRSLQREEIARIARRLLHGFTERPGFLQRHASIRLTTEAENSLIDCGYDPIYGARALKRTIETMLANPVASVLACQPTDVAIVISVDVHPDNDSDPPFVTEVHTLAEAAPVRPWRPQINQKNQPQLLTLCETHLRTLIARYKEEPPLIFSDGDDAEAFEHQLHGYSTAAALHRLSDDIQHHQLEWEIIGMRAAMQSVHTKPTPPHRKECWSVENNLHREIFAAADLNLYLDEVFSRNPVQARSNSDHGSDAREPVADLNSIMDRLIQLDYETATEPPERHWLLLYDDTLSDFLTGLPQVWEPTLGSPDPGPTLKARSMAYTFYRGSRTECFLQPFTGSYLHVSSESGATSVYQCTLIPVPGPDHADNVLHACLAAKNPLGPLGPLIFIGRRHQSYCYESWDPRTGKTGHRASSFLRAHLECPDKLKALLQHGRI